MKLEDRFQLAAAPDRVWDVLNDVELISPYVPGFELKEADGDVFRGTMKVKLGAMTVQYEAEITIAERDEAARSVRMLVNGRERRGSGKMKATVTSTLAPSGGGTAVSLDTDLDLAGKVAQMGRGMIADVSSKLVGDFVHALEVNVLNQPSGNGHAPALDQAASQNGSGAEAGHTGGPENVVDLTAVAGRSAAKRLIPPVLLVLVTLLLLRRRRR